MDADEKLTALKKAYADIILNTSKEAAARVMSSEMRAVRYQKEVKEAKDEALRMLLRLKQMMDSKMSEAEAVSLNQQKKIEELEAQLQEAEDIVRDLREELEEVQVELKRVKKHNSEHAYKSSNTCSREMETNNSCQSIKFLHPNSQIEFAMASNATVPSQQQRNEFCKCDSITFCMCCSYMGNRDLPSIILRGKKSGPYRNGCTQRILACERNLLDKELCLSVDTDKVKEKNNSREQEEGKDACTEPHSGAKNLSELEKKLLADIKLSNFQCIPRKRKRSVRLKSGLLIENFEKLELSSGHITVSAKESAPSSENPSEVASIPSPDEDAKSTHLGCVDYSRNGTNTMENLDGKMKEKTICLGKEIGSPECETEVGKDDLPSNSSDLNSSYRSEGMPSKFVGARVIKYTFQRKRKRVSLSESEVKASPGTETKTEDMQSGNQNVEQSKTSAILNESSRDSRRLAQVARQLISLSEKKWWH